MNNRTRFVKFLVVVPLALIIASYTAVVAKDLLDDYYSSGPRVLVDASRDGGGWWFPQPFSPGVFDPSLEHQGKALADYLRSQGMLVDELPRPYQITDELLQQYDLVVRAGKSPPASYAGNEITAYSEFVSEGGQLVLLSDFTWDEGGLPDSLARHFGLYLEGSEYGYIDDLVDHPITEGVSWIFYPAGSVLVEDPPPYTTELGFIDEKTAMGILPFGLGQIFFMGDIHSIVFANQPLTENLFTYFLTVEGLASQVLLAELDTDAEQGLLDKLEAAFKAFDSGRTTPFENQIEAFVNQVEALLKAGRIDPVVADSLIGAALTLIRDHTSSEATSCPCWTEEQIGLIPVSGEEAYCVAEERELSIWQSGCEHDFRVHFNDWGYGCTSNRFCIEPFDSDQTEINESEFAVCASQVIDRCKKLKIKVPDWP